MRIRSQCPDSIIPIKDYSKEVPMNSEEKGGSVSRLDSVIAMTAKLFGITEEELKESWGEQKLQDVKALLDDIDIVCEENKQLLQQIRELN